MPRQANPEIRFRLPAELLKKIEARDDCPPEGGPGRTGGASLWVRRLVLAALGEEAPEDPHAAQAARFAGTDFAGTSHLNFAMGATLRLIEQAETMARAAGLELQSRLVLPGAPPRWPAAEQD